MKPTRFSNLRTPLADRPASGRCRFIWLRWIVVALAWLVFISPTLAQASATESELIESPTQSSERHIVDLSNPLAVLQEASKALPNSNGTGSEEDNELEQTGLHSTLSIMALLTVLTIAPSLVILTTSFTRIVVVLSLLRQAVGTQSLPPSQVIVGLSMFMTFLVMAPTFREINENAIIPLQNNEINAIQAWDEAKAPLRNFMLAQIDYAGNWDDVFMILEYRGVDVSDPASLTDDDIDMLTLIPSFILSELKVAFLMGFRLYLPFLIVDMVISSVLISMGMMMLPPIMISLPFKLLLFVLVDGWHLVAGNLLTSFVTSTGGVMPGLG